MFSKKITTLMIALSFGLLAQTASAKTILLVPQDDRPVSYAYTVSTAQKAGYDVLTPPAMYLSGKDYRGYPDAIWDWVEKHAKEADVIILATDTLIYGGLVDSRKHNEDLSVLQAREKRIRSLHHAYPSIPIYGFSTIMRTPYASGGGVEPYYYDRYGNDIYQIAGLQDKQDEGTITSEETARLLSLKLTVPTEYLQDWFRRRTKNNIINSRLVKDTKEGVFSYFCEGYDDNSKHSQTTLEARYQKQNAKMLTENTFGAFPGADQLALLLIARYHVKQNHMTPTFDVIYPLGRGESTVPSYENQSIGKTIQEHVIAVGGTLSDKGIPDIMLAVNTPLASTGESGQFSNFGMMKPSTTDFISKVKKVIENGIPLAMVDVYFANGSDNTLMSLMSKNNLLYRVAAYNGWNTASNTIGYAVAQSILSSSMTPSDHKNMLIEQYLDNWAYQANVRNELRRYSKGKYNKEIVTPLVENEMRARLQDFAQRKMGINPHYLSADFPWARLFEINARVSSTPQYRLYLTEEEINKRKAIADKKKALEKKKRLERHEENRKHRLEKAEGPKNNLDTEDSNISQITIQK